MQGAGGGAPRLLGVGLDEIDDAVDERVGESRLDGAVAPRQVVFLLLPLALDGRGRSTSSKAR
jgi:hypothetical protein